MTDPIDQNAAGEPDQRTVKSRVALERRGAARRLRHSIDRRLRSRNARPGTAASHVEDLLKNRGQRLWSLVKAHPSIGIAAATGFGLAAASLIGVGELAFAFASGYAAYEVLKEGIPIGEALKEAKNVVD